MQALTPSPLNYTGGKFRLLPQILPLFPKKIRIFADLFCGGGSVGINACAERVIYNDRNCELAGLLRLFRERPEEEIVGGALSLMRRYGLSMSREHGYGHYGRASSQGLAAYNRKGFLLLRNAYNSAKAGGADAAALSLMLYVLVVYSFNNQIRFNSAGFYNLPVGKRDFNRRMESKLRRFIRALQAQNCEISAADFRDFDIGRLDCRDFVYCDPPYLVACASYNENGGWSEEAEKALLDFLDRLAARNVNFALSNALESKGRSNELLKKRLRERDFRVWRLKRDYSNSSYRRLDKNGFTDEVLITNYKMSQNQISI